MLRMYRTLYQNILQRSADLSFSFTSAIYVHIYGQSPCTLTHVTFSYVRYNKCWKWPLCACSNDSTMLILFAKACNNSSKKKKKAVQWSLCLTNYVRHKDIRGSGCIDAHFRDLSTRWRCVINFKPKHLTTGGSSLQYPLHRKLGGVTEPNYAMCRSKNCFFLTKFVYKNKM